MLAAKRAPIVLLPGFLCDERLWQNQIVGLSEIAKTSVVDLRHCQNLDEMLKAVGQAAATEKINLVGFSMGGYVAQVFATQYPERIQSLCIIASSGGPLSETEIKGRLRIESMLKNAKYRGMSPKEMHRYVHPDSLKNPQITDLILAMSADNTSEMYLNQMNATLYRKDQISALQNCQFPVAIIGAEEDKIVSKAEILRLHQGVTRSKLSLVSHCGHYIPLEKPHELLDLVKEFVK